MKKYDDCIREDGDCRACDEAGHVLDCHDERIHFDTPDEYKNTVDDMESIIIEALGTEGALAEIDKALGYDARADLYEFIIRMHDLEGVR